MSCHNIELCLFSKKSGSTAAVQCIFKTERLPSVQGKHLHSCVNSASGDSRVTTKLSFPPSGCFNNTVVVTSTPWHFCENNSCITAPPGLQTQRAAVKKKKYVSACSPLKPVEQYQSNVTSGTWRGTWHQIKSLNQHSNLPVSLVCSVVRGNDLRRCL